MIRNSLDKSKKIVLEEKTNNCCIIKQIIKNENSVPSLFFQNLIAFAIFFLLCIAMDINFRLPRVKTSPKVKRFQIYN